MHMRGGKSGLLWTPSPLKSRWMRSGRSLRGSLWKEVEVLRHGSSLGASVYVVCWKEWRLAARVSMRRGLLKVRRMEEVRLERRANDMSSSVRTESRVGVPEENAKESFADVLKSRVRRLGEAVWLQLGEKDVLSRRELLDWCLVGRWESIPFLFQTCLHWVAEEDFTGT
ncbi:hypothetical protein CK203_051261 [Vitis vinifera]|uniref:Uncharacterized protein n=1 Tax=Vitis vinifera TaxID=29760 RepID=A0A438H8C5_VITVI|nr:hypothetical protein CK203_051261 [Vitis vinifera]